MQGKLGIRNKEVTDNDVMINIINIITSHNITRKLHNSIPKIVNCCCDVQQHLGVELPLLAFVHCHVLNWGTVTSSPTFSINLTSSVITTNQHFTFHSSSSIAPMILHTGLSPLVTITWFNKYVSVTETFLAVWIVMSSLCTIRILRV